jgi:hypothetical protein
MMSLCSLRKNESSWKLRAVVRRAISKNLIHPLAVQDHKDEGFEDLLSRTPVQADDRDGETTTVT